MKRRNVKVNTDRFWVMALMLFALVLLGLLVNADPDGFEMKAGAAQRPGFYMEHGAIKAGYEPPFMYVKATKSKDRYDALDFKGGSDSDLKFSVKVSGRCPEKWRLSGGSLSISGNGKSQQVDYPIDSSHRSIGPDNGQGWDVYAFRLPLTPPQGASPVDRCNAELDRAGNDAARKKLLSEGFNFTLEKAYRAELGIWCEDKSIGFNDPPKLFSAETFLPLNVRCLPVVFTKGPPPRPGKVLDPPIKSVTVIADPAETAGRKCPVYVNFRGKITASEGSQYTTFNTKYRFIGENNYATDWLPVSIERGVPRSVNGRRFIQSSDTPRGLKNPGGTQNVPIFHGWMMLEVLLPDDTIRSEKALFSVDCNQKPLR